MTSSDTHYSRQHYIMLLSDVQKQLKEHDQEYEHVTPQELIDRIDKTLMNELKLEDEEITEAGKFTYECEATDDECARQGIKHKMRRWDCYHTSCINEGCGYSI